MSDPDKFVSVPTTKKVRLLRPDETLGEYMGVKQHAPRKLDIACGQNKQKGFKGIDIAGDADITHDLFKTPWPIKAACVQEAFCSHFVEHIPHDLPGHDRDGFFVFMDELYRVMRKGGTARFIHPYVKNSRAFWDPTHVRFIHEMTWNYLNKDWREANHLDHYPVSCNFEIITVNCTGIPDDIMNRNDEYKMQALARNWDVVADLEVIVKKL